MLPFYKNALVTKPPKVLGLRLRPFSVIHAALLEAAESPFLVGGLPQPQDVILAVYLCRQKYPRVLQTFDGESLAFRWFMFRNLFRFQLCNMDQAIQRLQEYLEAYLQGPERVQWEDAKTKPLKVPWVFALIHRLSGGRHDGETLKGLWNMPVNLAFAHAAAVGEANGDDSLISEEDVNRIAAAKKRLAEEKAAE